MFSAGSNLAQIVMRLGGFLLALARAAYGPQQSEPITIPEPS
jgi:hypothetical protein